VIGFEPFKDLPTIVVAYVEEDWLKYEIKVVAINSKQENFDLIAAVDPDFSIDREVIIKRFDRQVAAKRREIEAIEEQRRYFETNFKAYWAQVSRQDA
jgi:hypothetical protein